MTYPVFASGDVLNASDMNAVGLWLVKSQTIGSGVSSVTVTNAFSADYDNYKITLTGGAGAAAQSINLRLGGSTTAYYQMLSYVTYATSVQTNLGVNNGAAFTLAGESSANMQTVNIDLLNPFDTMFTRMSGFYIGTVAGSIAGYHGVATSYTDFTLSVSTTMTGGIIRVYGYRD